MIINYYFIESNKARINEHVSQIPNRVSSPTVTITGVNGRSQDPGAVAIVNVAYACPSGTTVSYITCIISILIYLFVCYIVY